MRTALFRAPRIVTNTRPRQHRAWSYTRPMQPARFTRDQATDSGAHDLLPGFLDGKEWTRPVMQLQDDVHDQVSRELEPMHPAATRYAPDGVLLEQSLDGKAQTRIISHAGDGAIQYKCLAQAVFSQIGLLYTRSCVRACLKQGTPHLHVEIAGTQKSALLSVVFTPRLSTLRHMDYARKYFMNVPPCASATVLPFNVIHNRMMDRAFEGQGLVTLTSDGVSAPGKVYHHYHSRQVNTRLVAGHGALFTFDPSSEEAVAAVREDVTALVALWCAWAKADWAGGEGPALPEALQAECRDMTRIWCNQLDLDADAAGMSKIYGDEAAARIKQSVSGEASLGGAPWLDKP